MPENEPVRQVYSLDFDGTFSEDPVLWKWFAEKAIERGHGLWIVTARRNTAENLEELMAVTGPPAWRHKFTDLGAKKPWCEANGIDIDVWIDDKPEVVLYGV